MPHSELVACSACWGVGATAGEVCWVCGGTGLVALALIPGDDPGPVPADVDLPSHGLPEAVALLVLAFVAGDDLHLMCSDEGHRDRRATFALVGPDPNSRVIVGAPAYQFEPICDECAERARDYLNAQG